MAEELLLLGALLEAAERQRKQESESVNWVVPCLKCGSNLKRMKCRQAYNASSVTCDGCRKQVSADSILFHCPEGKNISHPQGFDLCLSCADKESDKIINVLRAMKNRCEELQAENQALRRNNNQQGQVQPLRNRIEELMKEKRQLMTRNNDNLDIIAQHKEQIQILKAMKESNQSNRNEINKQMERLQNDKMELQTRYRMVKQRLDEKLDVIEQYKDDLQRLKREKEEIITNYNQQLQEQLNKTPQNPENPGKKNPISPTLKAILTQKFFHDDESKQTPQNEYIYKVHHDLLGIAFASAATMDWMHKNCKFYEEQKHEYNDSGDVFSFDQFINAMDDIHNDNSNTKSETKPIVNLKEFDAMTMQKLQKSLSMLQKKYAECLNSTQKWTKVIQNIMNPNDMNPGSSNMNEWQYWNHHNIIAWMMSLENGRFLKYEQKLKMEFSKVLLKGMDLVRIQNANLCIYGVPDFHDQQSLMHHIDTLTGRKQKLSAYSSTAPDIASQEGAEGTKTYIK